MKITERLMSRTSVAAMAAFAPKPEGGTLPAFAERVDDAPPAGGDRDVENSIDALTPEEQALFEQGRTGQPPAPGPDDGGGAGDEPGDDDGDDDLAGGDDGAEAGAADGAAERQPAPPADGKPAAPKTISYHKHEREKKRLEKQASDLQAALDAARGETVKERETRLRLDERTKLLLEAIQQRQEPAAAAAPKVDEDPAPDKEADPLGYLEWDNRQLRKAVEKLSGGVQEQREVTAAEREEAQIYNSFSADLERAAQSDPTFGDAFVHLRETRYRELGFIYADIDITDPAQCAQLTPDDQARLSQHIQRSFHNEQMLVARQAIQAKKSPASVVRNLAISRGFVPKAAAPAGGDPPAARVPSNGGGRPSVPAVPGARPTVQAELEAIREGLGASKSLSDAGGSPGDGITPARIAEMSDDEFLDFYDRMPKGKLDRLMGKPAQ